MWPLPRRCRSCRSPIAKAVDVEVIQEPEKGFLGMGGKDAIVRVKPRPQARNRKRRRGRGEGEGDRRTLVAGPTVPGRPRTRGTREQVTEVGQGNRASVADPGQNRHRDRTHGPDRSGRPEIDNRSRPPGRPGNERYRDRESRDNQSRSAGPSRERGKGEHSQSARAGSNG